MVHEWALAEAIVEHVKARLGKDRALRKLVISLGELQAIDEEILRFSLTEILKSEGIGLHELEFIREPAILKCRKCGHEWGLKEVGLSDEVREAIHFVPEVAHSFIRCPKCGSRDFEVVKGRGIYLVEVVPE